MKFVAGFLGGVLGGFSMFKGGARGESLHIAALIQWFEVQQDEAWAGLDRRRRTHNTQ